MTRPAEWLSKSIYILATCLYFLAVVLRTWLFFQYDPQLGRALIFLFLWLSLLITEPPISRRWSGYFTPYLIFQTMLVIYLMVLPGTPDFMGTLLGVLSMQAMLRLPARIGLIWIGLCALLIVFLLFNAYQYQAIALALIYTAGNVFLGSYARTIRKAQMVRQYNQELAASLQQANLQLQDYSIRLEQVATVRERNRLARELHDSVTQTVFSMNLTSQSAALLFEHDRQQVGAQLERLYALARSALTEMQLLIDELKPLPSGSDGLPAALYQLLAANRFSEKLSVSILVDGGEYLTPAEEQSLFRIAQEALTNTLKHAQSAQAEIRLHLKKPLWMEIEDHGQGFNPQQVQGSGHLGLAGMRERAAEMDWNLEIKSSPEIGTCIRVEKPALEDDSNGGS